MTRPLTTRETDVLRYTAQDLSVHTIAQALRTTESTVRATRSRIIRALGARDIDHAIQIHNQPTQQQASPMPTQPRLFHLQRETDITGVSGTGTVAHGVQWSDGTVTIRWTGPIPSTVQWNSIEDAIAIHGHDGHTRIVWADGQPEQAAPPVATLLDLIDSLRDPEPCRLDHDGDCQEHYWFEIGTCPHARAAELFTAEPETGPTE